VTEAPWPRGLPVEEAARYIGLSVSTLRAEVIAGRAPKPIRLTRRRLVWLREDLDAYLDRAAGRSPTSGGNNPFLAAHDAYRAAIALKAATRGGKAFDELKRMTKHARRSPSAT
jgi:predicted DNA-binding transcriptional regulator AlpA